MKEIILSTRTLKSKSEREIEDALACLAAGAARLDKAYELDPNVFSGHGAGLRSDVAEIIDTLSSTQSPAMQVSSGYKRQREIYSDDVQPRHVKRFKRRIRSIMDRIEESRRTLCPIQSEMQPARHGDPRQPADYELEYARAEFGKAMAHLNPLQHLPEIEPGAPAPRPPRAVRYMEEAARLVDAAIANTGQMAAARPQDSETLNDISMHMENAAALLADTPAPEEVTSPGASPRLSSAQSRLRAPKDSGISETVSNFRETLIDIVGELQSARMGLRMFADEAHDPQMRDIMTDLASAVRHLNEITQQRAKGV